jgi:GDP-4-dehydro-6-deoxy-D-mannose reductase
MRKKILVTGATGFVGSHLCERLIEIGEADIYATKRYHLSRLDNVESFYSAINWIDCNLTDPFAVVRLFDQLVPDVIFHCAAESFVSPSWAHPINYMNVNYNATVNILEQIVRTGCKTTIHIPGSGEEYGDITKSALPINLETVMNPVNPYAVSKVAQDLIASVYHTSYGVRVIRTRSFNHEGPRRERVFGISWYAFQMARMELGLQERVLRVGHLEDKRNFTHVSDMVDAYILAVEKCEAGKLYLVGNSNPSAIFTFADAIEGLRELTSTGDFVVSQDQKFIRPTQVPFLIADTSDFERRTGWIPKRSFRNILEDTLGYWRERLVRNPDTANIEAL